MKKFSSQYLINMFELSTSYKTFYVYFLFVYIKLCIILCMLKYIWMNTLTEVYNNSDEMFTTTHIHLSIKSLDIKYIDFQSTVL